LLLIARQWREIAVQQPDEPPRLPRLH
jgi:hypothetical protein